MPFLARVLQPPSYGYERQGNLYIPSHREIFREFARRLNIFADRRNWIALFTWSATLLMAIPLVAFLCFHFSWPLFILGLVYSMVVLGTHGTIYYHRYSTHRAYKFSHPLWCFFVKHLVVKLIPEEVYVVSHHVHHWCSEKPGDPYNVNGGWLYCFLADANHQPIAKDLSEADYNRAKAMVAHTGIRLNSYDQYKKWGSICHPLNTFVCFSLNWAFWYASFWAMGGHALALAMFGFSGVWGIGVRTFNFDGHGAGKDKRKDGVDFNRKDLSINQLWPGLVTGEWHNNHHLFPNGARAGFLPYQLDYAWYFIRVFYWIGAISSYRDYYDDFWQQYYLPYQRQLLSGQQPASEPASVAQS